MRALFYFSSVSFLNQTNIKSFQPGWAIPGTETKKFHTGI